MIVEHNAGSVAQSPKGAVLGKPRGWLRLEALAVLTGALVAFAGTGQPWWLVPAALLGPDLLMVGYLRDSRIGALLYNIAHSTVLPAAIVATGWWGHSSLTTALGLIWLAHIGLDRSLGYGLKYDDHFQHTHLGHLGSPVPTSSTTPTRVWHRSPPDFP